MESFNEKRQTKLRTPFIHVPLIDWPAVRTGAKREYREHPNGGSMPATRNLPYFPILVVAWCQTRAGIRHEQLMILEEAWVEPLRAISPASLAAEGFETRAEYKKYWNRRHPRGGWRGLSQVIVIRMRPLDDDDLQEQKDALIGHLFGLWL